MSSVNPFQIPPCLQRADLQLRRQKRFQKIVVATVAGVAALLLVLLIEGCVSEHTKASASAPAVPTPPSKVAVVEPKPVSISTQKPVLQQSVAPAALKSSAPPTVATCETVYLVKSGDTLTRIAKQHGTTVKALKSLNDLNGDNIAVGLKLKLPAA